MLEVVGTSSTCVLLTASLALTTGAGNANCPCLTSYGTTLPTDSNGRLILMDTHRYLPTYGLSTCSAHDSGLAPYCNDANVTPQKRHVA